MVCNNSAPARYRLLRKEGYGLGTFTLNDVSIPGTDSTIDVYVQHDLGSGGHYLAIIFDTEDEHTFGAPSPMPLSERFEKGHDATVEALYDEGFEVSDWTLAVAVLAEAIEQGFAERCH